jgi:hypothetical protein
MEGVMLNVPLGIVITLFLQTAGAIWWASSMTQQIAAIDKRTELQQIAINHSTVLIANMSERLARAETTQQVLMSIMDDEERDKLFFKSKTDARPGYPKPK